MQDNYIFKTEDLVLKVNKTYDHSTLKLDDWDEFMKVFNEKNKTKFDIINLINAHTLLKILKNDS